MKKIKISIIALALVVSLTITACQAEKGSNRVIIKESGKSITVIDNDDREAGEPSVSVEKIERYKNIEISDWLNEDTVIVSKENESLDKMTLEELSYSYPRSLYLYNLNTKEYELIKEEKNLFLGGAELSPDKKHLLYYGNTLGDPIYYVISLDTLEGFDIRDVTIAGAYSAHWSDDGAVMGGAYSGGAYTASTEGEIAPLEDLKDEALFIVRKIKDKIYYNTNSDASLMVLDLAANEKTSLSINNVYSILPAPDGGEMLILQDDGSKRTMMLYDSDTGNTKAIAEGTEISGVSWSPDKRMIAYSLKAFINDTSVSGLYLHDILTGKNIQIAVDAASIATCWSPSEKALAYSEWNGTQYNSSIVYLRQP